MTTPENTPDPRPEPRYGQYAPRPEGDQAAPSPGYGYPAGRPKPTKGPAPREVILGSWLILAAGIVSFISNVITAFGLPSLMTPEEQQTLADSGMDSRDVTSFLVSFGIVVAVIGLGVYVLIALFIRRGKNWARILGTVFAAFALIGIFTMLGTYFTAPLSLLSLVSSLLGIAGIVLLYLPPSRTYFRTPPRYPF